MVDHKEFSQALVPVILAVDVPVQCVNALI